MADVVVLVLLATAAASAGAWWLVWLVRRHAEIVEDRPCVCGRFVTPGEPWSDARARRVHDWCVPPAITCAGDVAVRHWLAMEGGTDDRSAVV
jgi:hypothetical protein